MDSVLMSYKHRYTTPSGVCSSHTPVLSPLHPQRARSYKSATFLLYEGSQHGSERLQSTTKGVVRCAATWVIPDATPTHRSAWERRRRISLASMPALISTPS